MSKIFVADPVTVYYDAEAEARLAEINDSRFATERGILAVDEPRWNQAQQYERDTWLKYNKEARTDRNETHTDGFANYQALPQDVGNYIELGCGPFTNSRYIVPGRTLHSLSLLDPLILSYENEHPHCVYKGWQLAGHAVTPITGTVEAFILDEPAYDCVVMTNVLSHCYDAIAVLENAWRILRPGGYFVFHEDTRPFEPLELYDVGHPLVVPKDVIDEFLSAFEAVYRNGNYFIGRKPGGAAVETEAVEESTVEDIYRGMRIQTNMPETPVKKGKGRRR